jgi:hypothetical protein
MFLHHDFHSCLKTSTYFLILSNQGSLRQVLFLKDMSLLVPYS